MPTMYKIVRVLKLLVPGIIIGACGGYIYEAGKTAGMDDITSWIDQENWIDVHVDDRKFRIVKKELGEEGA